MVKPSIIQKMKTEIKYGVLIGTTNFAWLLAEFFSGLHSVWVHYHPLITNFALIIPVLGLFLGIREKQYEELGGEINFKQCLMTGMSISCITTLIGMFSQIIYHQWINPDYFPFLIEYSVRRAEILGEDVSLAYFNALHYFNLPSYLIQVGIGGLLMGLFLSLLFGGMYSQKSSFRGVLKMYPRK
jgi:uncharacterized membrane-anchored protein YitT (DUF2179 family)